jgi:Ca-activated chloride channel family protein
MTTAPTKALRHLRVSQTASLGALGVLGACDGSSFTFAWPYALLLLLVVAWSTVRDLRGRSGRLPLTAVAALRPSGRTLGSRLARARHVLRAAALTLVVFACARPQWVEDQDRSVEGIDIFLALDLSGSMYAVDMTEPELLAWRQQHGSDPPNRFDNAIVVLKRFMERRENDRIGMVIFAKDAYLQFPLTLDYHTIVSILDSLHIDMIDASATAIGNAIGVCVRGLMDSNARSRAIILITDGKQQGGNISPEQAAELAREEGLLLYSVLVGREGPVLMPDRAPRPGRPTRYVPQLQPVDPALLERISTRTGGQYYRAEDGLALERELNAILDDLEKTRMTDIATVHRQELAPLWALFAALLLLLESLIDRIYLRRLP